MISQLCFTNDTIVRVNFTFYCCCMRNHLKLMLFTRSPFRNWICLDEYNVFCSVYSGRCGVSIVRIIRKTNNYSQYTFLDTFNTGYDSWDLWFKLWYDLKHTRQFHCHMFKPVSIKGWERSPISIWHNFAISTFINLLQNRRFLLHTSSYIDDM